MAQINAFNLMLELPEEARPAALAYIIKENPTYWHVPRRTNDPELLSLLGTTPGALAERRRQGKGPPFSKVEGQVFYTLFECYEWLLRVQGIDPADKMLGSAA